MPVHDGANSLKKPHHIVILRFSEVVKCHAKYFEVVDDLQVRFEFGGLRSLNLKR